MSSVWARARKINWTGVGDKTANSIIDYRVRTVALPTASVRGRLLPSILSIHRLSAIASGIRQASNYTGLASAERNLQSPRWRAAEVQSQSTRTQGLYRPETYFSADGHKHITIASFLKFMPAAHTRLI